MLSPFSARIRQKHSRLNLFRTATWNSWTRCSRYCLLILFESFDLTQENRKKSIVRKVFSNNWAKTWTLEIIRQGGKYASILSTVFHEITKQLKNNVHIHTKPHRLKTEVLNFSVILYLLNNKAAQSWLHKFKQVSHAMLHLTCSQYNNTVLWNISLWEY